ADDHDGGPPGGARLGHRAVVAENGPELGWSGYVGHAQKLYDARRGTVALARGFCVSLLLLQHHDDLDAAEGLVALETRARHAQWHVAQEGVSGVRQGHGIRG